MHGGDKPPDCSSLVHGLQEESSRYQASMRNSRIITAPSSLDCRGLSEMGLSDTDCGREEEESGQIPGKSIFTGQTEQKHPGKAHGKKGVGHQGTERVACLPWVRRPTKPQGTADGKAGLGEQAKWQVLGSLTRDGGMCGKQDSHPQSLLILHFSEQQPCPWCWAPELNTWHHSVVSGTGEEFISWTKQPKLFCTFVFEHGAVGADIF